MARRIDHVVLAGSDLEEMCDWFESITGIIPVGGGQHLGWGTKNRLVSLGPRMYLELIAPDPAQPAPDGPRPLGVDGLREGEHRVTGFACRVEGIESVIDELREQGYDPGDSMAMSRELPNGDNISWKLTPPRMEDGVGVLPFLIDWGDSVPPPQTLPKACQFRRLFGTHPEPDLARKVVSCLGVDFRIDESSVSGLTLSFDSPKGPVELG